VNSTFDFKIFRRQVLTWIIVVYGCIFKLILLIRIFQTSSARFGSSYSSQVRVSLRYLVLNKGNILLILSNEVDHPLIIC
jgi:beta-lactamase regulating signal transducer with metallopeptidase domain